MTEKGHDPSGAGLVGSTRRRCRGRRHRDRPVRPPSGTIVFTEDRASRRRLGINHPLRVDGERLRLLGSWRSSSQRRSWSRAWRAPNFRELASRRMPLTSAPIRQAAIPQPLLASEASAARTVSSRRPASSAIGLSSDCLVRLTMICGSRMSTTVPPSVARTTTLQGSNRPM